MPRGAMANNITLSWLLVRGGLRRVAGRLNGHPLLRWPLPIFKADRLLIAPQDLRTADATRATEIYSGRFAFAGKVVVCDGRSIFEMEPPSDEWAAALLGFGWLRHLRAAESAHHARQCARAGGRMDRDCKVRGIRWAGAPTCCRGASSPGSARRRWFWKMPTRGSTAASCAALCVRYAICAIPRSTRGAASPACRPSSRSITPRSASPASRAISNPRPRACNTNSNARSCPTAATSAAIPARSSRCCWSCCRSARPTRRATSRRRSRCSAPSSA